MDLIIDFYKSLDTLNLIIFWGIIIVIILLLIFSSILITKNKKTKRKIDDTSDNEYEEDLPIKEEQPEIIGITMLEEQNEGNPLEEIIKEDETNLIAENNEENEFIAEEHVIEFKEEEKEHNDNNQEKQKEYNINNTIEIPTKPYQRNVLREMSLSQTSPIGINRQSKSYEKEIIKDLEESLKEEQKKDIDYTDYNEKQVDTEVKNQLNNIDNYSERKTTIINGNPKINSENDNYYNESRKSFNKTINEEKKVDLKYYQTSNDNLVVNEPIKEKSSSKKYLEEVSKKLSEAEMPDEVERTIYELQQEEDAIISYKELMEKKDTIQTVDEEDAIISIEELMNRNNNQTTEEDNKLYNITDSEENDNFIKELKQFRNDL